MKAAIIVIALLMPGLAFAQPHRGSIEVSGAFAWTGGYAAGMVPATETPNPSSGSTPFTLFQTDSHLLGAIGVDARAGVYLTRCLLVSATFRYSRPTLRTHLSADFEGATDTDAETSASSYLVGGSAEYQFRRRAWIPFVSGGAGQSRQVPDGGDVVTGAEIHAGGGVRRALTHGRHPFGLRGELLVSYRSRSLAFDRTSQVVPSASAGLMWGF